MRRVHWRNARSADAALTGVGAQALVGFLLSESDKGRTKEKKDEERGGEHEKTLDNPEWVAAFTGRRCDLETFQGYIKRKQNAASARSDTLICADKAVRENTNISDSGTGNPTTTGGGETVGNHTDGFNIGYADGHVSFVPTAETGVMQRLNGRAWVYSSGGTAFDPDAHGGE